MKNKTKYTTVSWLLLISLVLIWGSSFIIMKKGLLYFSAVQVGALRLGITFLFLIPFVIKRIPKVTRKQLPGFLIVGIIGNGIPAYLFAIAQTGLDSSITGVLNSLTPLFALLIGLFFFKFKAKWYNIVGVFIGLFGTIGLLTVIEHGFIFNFRYAILVIIATILYAINLNVIKYYLKDVEAITITSFAFTFVGLPSLIFLFTSTNFVSILATNSSAYLGLFYIAILAIVGSGIALILYYNLIKYTNIIFAASVTYLMPAVALMWGLIDGEPFEVIYILWITIILLGIYLTNKTFGKNTTG
jgi:drug/metabolite transporter (DMT)-like permease